MSSTLYFQKIDAHDLEEFVNFLVKEVKIQDFVKGYIEYRSS